MLLMQQPDLSVRRGYSYQHAVRGHQGWQHCAIDLEVGDGADLVAPQRDLVEDHRQQRAAADGAERVGVRPDDDAVLESNFGLRGTFATSQCASTSAFGQCGH
jgi:hypothetical protein